LEFLEEVRVIHKSLLDGRVENVYQLSVILNNPAIHQSGACFIEMLQNGVEIKIAGFSMHENRLM
jgi:hypothetical protein